MASNEVPPLTTEARSPQPASSASGSSGAATVRWKREIAMLQGMGIDVDTEMLQQLLECHNGELQAVLGDLFV